MSFPPLAYKPPRYKFKLSATCQQPNSLKLSLSLSLDLTTWHGCSSLLTRSLPSEKADHPPIPISKTHNFNQKTQSFPSNEFQLQIPILCPGLQGSGFGPGGYGPGCGPNLSEVLGLPCQEKRQRCGCRLVQKRPQSAGQ